MMMMNDDDVVNDVSDVMKIELLMNVMITLPWKTMNSSQLLKTL